MSEKCFWLTLTGVVTACLTATVAHFVYAVYAYQHASIIYFIAKELWG